ncbi:hypothetical protein EJB05_17466, partial [Eragrostis curvula]
MKVQAFDSLVSSLDTRGSREAQLHSMLQMIEATFKEAVKRSAATEQSSGRNMKNGATDMIRANFCSEFGSPSNVSESAKVYSDCFKIELGRNDFEKIAISKRADGFLNGCLIPSEALQSFGLMCVGKSWGVKLYSTKSIGEMFQLLTLLESAIRRDFLSSDFETTSECLNTNSQDIASQNPVGSAGSVTVLPWVPDTTAAIMLRMLDLDAAILYIQNQKMERDGGDFMKFPSRYTVGKNTQKPHHMNQLALICMMEGCFPVVAVGVVDEEVEVVAGEAEVEVEVEGSLGVLAAHQGLNLWMTLSRMRKCQGRMHVEGVHVVVVEDEDVGLSKPATVESPRSSGADEWGLETRIPYIEGDENRSGSESDQSEDNEENGQPMDVAYEQQVPDYSVGYSGVSRPHGLMPAMDRETTDEEDEDAEGDGDGDDYVEEDDADQADDDIDAEMEEDDEIGDDGDGDDGGDGMEMDADEDDVGTSYSSDCSE